MRTSVFLKIIIGYFVIIFFLSSSIIIFLDDLIRHFYINQLSTNLKNSIILFKPQVITLINERKYRKMDELIKKLGKETQTGITVIAPDGSVLADSEEDPQLMENYSHRPEVISALKTGYGESIRYSSTVSSDMLYVAMPLKDDGEIKGVIRMSLFLNNFEAFYRNLRGKIVISSVIFSLISFFVVFFLSRRFTKSITHLSEAAHRLAFGDYDTKVFLKRKDELKDLAESFNFMAGQIKSSFEELKRQRAELDAIVNSMSEGLIVIDREGNILLSNKSFKKISGVNKPEGKTVGEAFRSVEFNEALKQFQRDKKPSTREIKYGDNFYLCNFTSVNNEFTIVIMHDTTEFKKLEKIKRDFVTNISHELRTPLTAIKGFIETIEEKPDEKNKPYIEIIKRNTERVINIVKDLLVLSEVEDRENKPLIEKVNLKGLLESISKLFEKQLKEKSLYLKINITDETSIIMADYFKLEQLFINLIDNGIKYTEKGGITIDVKKEERNIKIKIEDTGIGIPGEHLSRIFERFYVVDKSRSKRLGGTGLGLSIVKHIVLLHNGSINVESTPGKGTRFTVVLPENPG